MNTDKKSARNIGLLFILTMILGMIDAYAVAPILNTSLNNIGLNEIRVIVGAFCILLMSIGVVFIAVLLYPIIENHSKTVAITYLSFRIMECLLLIVGVIVYLLLIILSKEIVNEGTGNLSSFHTIVNLAVETRYGAYQVAMFILSIASIMLCYLFYQTKLIPRFISIVGLFGYTLVLLSSPLDILGIIDTTDAGGIMYIPAAIFELILLPAWLMTKGFNSTAAVSESL